MSTVMTDMGGQALAVVLSEENFHPTLPRTLEETGLSATLRRIARLQISGDRGKQQRAGNRRASLPALRNLGESLSIAAHRGRSWSIPAPRR